MQYTSGCGLCSREHNGQRLGGVGQVTQQLSHESHKDIVHVLAGRLKGVNAQQYWTHARLHRRRKGGGDNERGRGVSPVLVRVSLVVYGF